jgi:hypothetical protein
MQAERGRKKSICQRAHGAQQIVSTLASRVTLPAGFDDPVGWQVASPDTA